MRLNVFLILLLAGFSEAPAAEARFTEASAVAEAIEQSPSSAAKGEGAKKGGAKSDATKKEATKKKAGAEDKAAAEKKIGHFQAAAVKKVATAIQQSLEVGPTLIVWHFDRTASAKDLVRDVSAAALEYYQSPTAQAALTGDKMLLTAIATFDEQTSFPLEEPSADLAKIQSALEGLATSNSSHERPFGAVKQTLEKYLSYRTRERREVILVVVTDEAGEDGNLVDELVEITRRQAISVYAIGLPAPWGQKNPFVAEAKMADAADETMPVLGPESILSERVDLVWTGHQVSDVIDSGFGPFALERLCRASHGQFFALRGSGFGYRGKSLRSWPSGKEPLFDARVVQKYAPDYVSQAEYQRRVAENKARAALVEAAKMPTVVIQGTPGRNFPKDVEAKMARQLNSAQQFAASNSPRVDRLFEVLGRGEPDRSKLEGPRWQAEFDLAYGRVLANKARLDGYNSMIAALKRGKNFQKPDSKTWVLEPADHFETESTIQRMADKAKTYLQRVIQEHPGTPWAKIAEEELKLPLGWSWSEK